MSKNPPEVAWTRWIFDRPTCQLPQWTCQTAAFPCWGQDFGRWIDAWVSWIGSVKMVESQHTGNVPVFHFGISASKFEPYLWATSGRVCCPADEVRCWDQQLQSCVQPLYVGWHNGCLIAPWRDWKIFSSWPRSTWNSLEPHWAPDWRPPFLDSYGLRKWRGALWLHRLDRMHLSGRSTYQPVWWTRTTAPWILGWR